MYIIDNTKALALVLLLILFLNMLLLKGVHNLAFGYEKLTRLNIKSSHLIYQNIVEEIYPTVSQQIEMKNKFITQLSSHPFRLDIIDLLYGGYGDIHIEGKDKLFLDKCCEASKSKRGQTPHGFFMIPF